jgi:hypothetical protein
MLSTFVPQAVIYKVYWKSPVFNLSRSYGLWIFCLMLQVMSAKQHAWPQTRLLCTHHQAAAESLSCPEPVMP